MTITDDELREALAPLRADEPARAEVSAVLAAAARPARRPWSSRRLGAGVAAASAAAVAALALLAGTPSRERIPAPLTAIGILRTTAAVAAEQTEPPPWAGYRYVRSRDLWTYRDFTLPPGAKVPVETGDPYTIEQTEETWVDRQWHGRRLAPAGRIVDGQAPARGDYFLKPHDISAPDDMPNLYGDGALADVPLSELPTDPKQLYDLLVAANQDLRWSPGNGHWAPGRPTAAQARYDVLRAVLLLLTEANATPAQRAALIGALGEFQGVTPVPSARDHAGREGRGVEIPVTDDNGRPQPPVRVIFAPHTSELLEWSEGGTAPGQVHTFLAFGHVAAIGDRP